jgi:antitoxin (DNA-binding transcriptional repressor) of toxin-antitoxin stability system
MLNMQTVTTRDLSHHAARVTKILRTGRTLAWTSRGHLIARIVPAANPEVTLQRDWLSRARQAGAVNRTPASVADSIYADRD